MNKPLTMQFLGQAGYLFEQDGMTVAIDPYLSDSAAASDDRFKRLYPAPIEPDALRADVYIVTHDHLDHLDPDTIVPYRHRETTQFVAPRRAARKLISLGMPEANVHVVDHGDALDLPGVRIEGVFALGTTPDTVDTCGYLLTFDSGTSVYHTADTSWCQLLSDCAPRADALLVCINGKFGNLNVHEAAALTEKVKPRFVFPNHFDVMALNSEDPRAFAYLIETQGSDSECVIQKAGEVFTWPEAGESR